jgi:hypothetical protein
MLLRKLFEPDIQFYPTYRGLEKISPIIKASKCLPSWWKTANKNEDQTFTDGIPDEVGNIKKCPGIADFLLNGFVLRSWTDIVIDPIDDCNCEIRPSIQLPSVAMHTITHSTYKPHLPLHALEKYTHIIKIQTPWLVKTKRGTSVIIDNPYYFFNNNFDCAPGIQDSDIFFSITLQLLIKSKKQFMIPFGTPLAIIRPHKRKKYSCKINQFSKKVEYLLGYSSLISFCKYSSSNMYNMVRQKNKCPFS